MYLLPIIPAFTDNHLLIGGNGPIVQTKNNTIDVMNPISANSTLLIKQLISKYNLNYLVNDRWNYASKVKENTPIIKQIDPGKLAKRVPLNTIVNSIKIILLNIPDQVKNSIANMLTDREDLSVVEHTGENDIDITSVISIVHFENILVINIMPLEMTVMILNCWHMLKKVFGLAAKIKN